MDCMDIYITPFHGQITFKKEMFHKILKNLKQKPLKSLSKSFKKCIHKQYFEELIFEQTFTNEEYKSPTRENVYSLTEVSFDDTFTDSFKKDDILIMSFMKKNYNLCQFPSSHKIYECVYEKKEIFKMNNRTYLNFIEAQYMSDKKQTYYYIMLNYINSEGSDRNLHSAIINDVINHIIHLAKTL